MLTSKEIRFIELQRRNKKQYLIIFFEERGKGAALEKGHKTDWGTPGGFEG